MLFSLPFQWTLRQRIAFAQTACLCLGLGMLFLSVAPQFIERIITKHAPANDALLANSATMLLSTIFLVLSVLIRHERLWAIWTAFLISTLMAGSGIAVVVIAGVQSASSFVLLLSACTCYGCWRAIDAAARHNRAEPSATAAP